MEMLARRRVKGRGQDEAVKGQGQDEAAGGDGTTAAAIKITLNFKRFIFDPKKQMYQ